MLKIRKNRDNVIREKMNIKISVLDYIRYKPLTGMATCKEWMKKGYLKKCWECCPFGRRRKVRPRNV